MRIVPIFAPTLFAFHYKGEKQNELSRLLNLWNNPVELISFIKEHKEDVKNIPIDDLLDQLLDDAETIDQNIIKYANAKTKELDVFFKPLDNKEYRLLSLSKQKGRQNYFRLYAIKIDNNCFVITGGGIKFPKVHLMQDREHLNQELLKLEKCKTFLKKHGVFDNDSFFEFLTENI